MESSKEDAETDMFEKIATMDRVKIALRNSIVSARRRLTSDELLHHGSILAVATVLSGGINYLFQIFMGRALGPEQYGVFGALFALFYLVGIFGSGIKFSVTRFTAERDPSDRELSDLHTGLFVRSLLLGVVICVALLVASPFISQFLGLSTVWPVVIVALTVPFTFAFMANQGSFQGIQWFVPLGGYNVLQAGVKLLAGIVLVLVGYGIYGAFAAMVIGAFFGVALTTYHLRKRLPETDSSFRNLQFDYERVYKFVSPAVLAGFCLTVPANVDVIVVKHSFTSEQAGLYTAASVLGKVLIFLPMGISGALFPKVTEDYTSAESDRLTSLLDRALLYTAAVAGFGTLVFWALPTVVLETFFGAAYAAAAPLLRWYGVAILGFVLAVVVLNFELARDRMRFVYVFAAVTVAEIGLMWVFDGSMIGIIQVILFANVGLLVYGIARVRT